MENKNIVQALIDQLNSIETTPSQAKLDVALQAWAKRYSERLDRINTQMDTGNRTEDYSGYEQDLFEALGSIGIDHI
jgi:hypothetical protein